MIFDKRGICSLPVTGFRSEHLGSKQPKINIQSTKIDNKLICREGKHMKFCIKSGKCRFFHKKYKNFTYDSKIDSELGKVRN